MDLKYYDVIIMDAHDCMKLDILFSVYMIIRKFHCGNHWLIKSIEVEVIVDA